MMKPIVFWAVAAVVVSTASVAQAQASRTWVSGVGDDVNPCSRTAPCKTFAGAISKTAAGGEISVLDPGGYGGVTITKSISINAEGAEGGVLVSGTNAIVINGTDIVVNLRGLMIEGLGTGTNGIRFIHGAALHVQNCVIRRFRAGGAGNQNGILFAPSTLAELNVSDTVIADNGAAGVGAGVMIRPTAGGSARVTLTRVQVMNNELGVIADGNTTTGSFVTTISDSLVANNTDVGVGALSSAAGAIASIVVDRSTIAHNGGVGLLASGSNGGLARGVVRVGRSTIAANATAGSATAGGLVGSYGTNQINGNGVDGTFTPVPQS